MSYYRDMTVQNLESFQPEFGDPGANAELFDNLRQIVQDLDMIDAPDDDYQDVCHQSMLL